AAGGGHRLAHVCRLLDRIERTETELCGLLSVPVVAPAPIHARPVYAPRPTHLPQLIQAPQHVVRRHVYNPPIYSHRPHYEYGRPTLQIGNQCFSLRIGF
ncbi:MAG: hypothetical protein QF805_06830, partial [Pirellulaceae bacterium]|nr:hypothetical protein [Pirellulaceae bacterium]